MTTTQLVLGLVCVTLGATVHSTIGFGAALLSVPLLLLINPDFVPGPITVAGLAVNLFVLSANRGHADWRGVRWAGLGLLPGTALGAVALILFTGSSLAVLAGSAVLVAVAVCAAGSRLPEGRRTLLGAGFFSGYLGTTAGISGPPLVLAYQDAPAATLRATLSWIFLAGAFLTLLTLRATDHLHAADWRTGLILAPGGLFGFVASRPLVGHVDSDRLRTAVLVVSALSAVAAIARALV